jgi:hypothetical protein
MKASNLDREDKLWFFMDKLEERKFFEEVCDRIIKNPRYYLDNLDELYVFKVSFIHYGVSRKRKLYKEGAI